jgi:ribonuclease VapC
VIIDTSAIVAIVLGEADADAYARLIARARVARISAATALEVSVVVDRTRNAIAIGALDALLASPRLVIEPFTQTQASIARTAYQRFGRGSGHPARLNMGDCFAYALARDLGEPLLFKGGDFSRTDIELVVKSDDGKRLSEVIASYGA